MAESHQHDRWCAGVEMQGVFDGALFWHCSDGELRNRWNPDTEPKRHALAEQYMDLYRNITIMDDGL